MIKTITILLNFTFKCRLVNETRVVALVEAGMQADQLAIAIDLASAIDLAGNITNFTKSRASKSFFFIKTQERRAF